MFFESICYTARGISFFFFHSEIIINKFLCKYSWSRFNAHTFEKEADAFNPRMSVCHRERFDHLPPALFILAECDTLRDDSYGESK